MKDNQKLQVLQNNLNNPRDVLQENNSLSVQRMIAYHTALLGYEISIAEKMQNTVGGMHLRGGRE